ncbi:DUF2651 family protein [Aquisalibacillus elongatus]|uniref:Uncharacterized protein DUF2651 n=1 Tax=Aquisalibacillus elongatus TaxID=485577 RepID=A0A3N5BZL4_9BACI|nr:DUF2651 family protein [Aquisalibacillus elongatus]RPF55268.1 uncharacterized protein DUF2651 [Aquisalibacillus elongatus]
MNLIDSIDPFLMQLVILPIIVIGLGVLGAALTKKFWLGPLITLVLNLLYELWYSSYYYPESDTIFTSWNVILPIISLIISFMVVFIMKARAEEN